MSSKPICVFTSPIFTRSGYGDWALSLAKSLDKWCEKKSFDLKIIPTRWGNCSKRNLEADIAVDPESKRLVDKLLRDQLTKQPELYLQCTIPNEFQPLGKYNIGLTAGIETTLAAGPWIEGINRMNVTVATSEHARNILVNTKLTKNHPDGRQEPIQTVRPVETIFWGADTNVFKKTSEISPEVDRYLSEIPENFAFLFVGQWTANNIVSDRKDIGMLIKTFCETFKGKKNKPCLILKTSGAAICTMDRYECVTRIRDVRRMVSTNDEDIPNVYLLYGELTDLEMNSLYNHPKIKVHVSFTHGEGFGHPLLLATLSGKPVVAPKWSGHLDFLNPEYSQFFSGEIKQIPGEAVNDWFVRESGWFCVDYGKASEKLNNLFQYYGGKFLENAESLRIENSQKFSLEAMDAKFHAFLDEYVPKFAVEQKIILPKLQRISVPKETKS